MAPFKFLAALVGLSAITCNADPQPTPAPAPGPYSHLNFSTVTGFFSQDEASTNPATFDYTANNFGLINRTYPTDIEDGPELTQWQKFGNYIDNLNCEAPSNVAYKVLFMGRHGEGYHNAAESYFGTPAWNCYWSLLDGNATVTWADALLTPAGVRQAEIAAAYWLSRINEQKIPLPDTYYSSPLSRCLETAKLTFAKLPLRADQPFIPTVKELLREGISGHTCDRRRSKTYIHEGYPTYEIESGFSENDELFRPLLQEPSQNQDIRSKNVLDEIMATDEHTWISITSHSGEISSILRVLGHQTFKLNTGAIIPVLVKAERLPGPAPASTTLTWNAISTCASAPTTAVSSSSTTTTAPTPSTTLVCNANNCLRALRRFSSQAREFCATYTTTQNTEPTAIPTYLDNCSKSPSKVSSGCACLAAATPST